MPTLTCPECGLPLGGNYIANYRDSDFKWNFHCHVCKKVWILKEKSMLLNKASSVAMQTEVKCEFISEPTISYLEKEVNRFLQKNASNFVSMPNISLTSLTVDYATVPRCFYAIILYEVPVISKPNSI